jgi:murein DD-endopeptidase MepM/ murein hydrolase activator NlpD
MSKHKLILLAPFRSRQKTGSALSSGQKYPQQNSSILSRLGLFLFIVLGLISASILALLGPIYFYPGTVAAHAASKTIDSIHEQGIKKVMKSADVVMRQIKDHSSDLAIPAPVSLSAIIIQPVALPKLELPTPVLALPAVSEEKNSVTTELIAETIKESIDPMITTPQTVLFPSEISLNKVEGVGGREEVATEVKTEVVAPKPSPTPVKIVSTPKPSPTAVAKAQPAVFSGNYRWPVTGMLSQKFSRYHPGIDIATKYGTNVYPVADGVVAGVITQWVGLGKHIIIEHSGGLKSVYAHLSDMKVSLGQSVTQGTIIGHVGLTGRTTGAHLHFETYLNGVAVSPLGRFLN